MASYNTFKGHNAVHVASIDVDNYHLTCAGESVSTMAHFIKQVRQRMAATQGSAGDQSDIPFHKRKPDAVIDFHPHVYAPLHCGDLLVSAVEQHMTFAVSKGWLFSAKDLHDSTVSAFTNGKNVFSGVQDLDLTRTMVEYIYTQQVDWPSTLLSEKDSIMRIVDFGPSGGPMPLHEQTVLTIQGRGIQLLQYADSRAPLDTTLSPAANWRTQFGPAVFDSSNNMLHTRLSNLIGLPPVFVGATAPTTRSVDFVAAVAHAGYHAELSVEDTLSSDELADRITRLADAIPPGHGITVSCRANHKDDDSRQQWQLRAIARLRQQNQHPIIGVCVNDSISASEIAMLQRAGIRYIALRAAKPSDIDGALGIAQSCAAFPVVIQWTGGRCGGVHSFEDFHIPLLVDAYGRMRAQGNVVLVASSGFGDADGVVPYLTGAWGEMFNRSCMPFDGVMLSSRMMVARESPVADAAKQLIVSRAPGVDPFDMLALFGDAPEGGIVSIRNEHGQPRHVVANRAAKFCHKVSAEILLQPRDKVASALKANRDWILRGLCKDFMRPWFGQSEHPLELSEMTYIQVIDRLVELMHVAAEHRWIHATYRNFVAKFVRRTSMRLQNAEHAFMPELKQGVVYDDAVFDEIATVKLAYPDAHTQLLASADIQYFASLCKRPGQKAVPFVPFLDADFADYLMRDTEWQCQDLASVYNGSAGLDDAAQRVLLNHGPVAARYSLVANEPVNDIMDRIYNGAVQLIIPELPATDIEQLDPESLLSMESLEHTVIAYHSSEGRTYQLPLHPQSEGPETLPSIRAWHRVLPRSSDSKGNTNNNNWLHSILTSPAIVQDKKLVDNYVSRLLRPRYGRAVTVIDDATAVNSQASPLSVKVWNNGPTPTTLETSHRSSSLELSLTLCNDNVIELVLPHRNSSLVLRFLYTGNKTPLAPIHEIMDGRDDRIARFYTDLWRRGTDTQTPAIPSPSSTSMSCCTAPQTYTQCRVPVCRDFSLDMLAIEALPGVFGILTDGCVSAGLLDMVQTEYAVEKCNGGSLFASLSQGDELDIVSRVNEMRTVPGLGKQVVAVSDVFVSGTKRKCAEIRATFLFKGAAVAPGRCFRHVEEPTATISAIAGDVLKVLESKEWFYHIVSDQRAREGDTLEFHLRSEYTLSSTGAYLHAATKGS
ncbi:fatty acid synthase alpha subunit Lsd1, partial [Coemansia sp. RSA 2399]